MATSLLRRVDQSLVMGVWGVVGGVLFCASYLESDPEFHEVDALVDEFSNDIFETTSEG